MIKKFRPEELEFILSRLVNLTNSAEGSTLPPKQAGALRVPVVSNLKLLRIQAYFGNTQFTIAWNEPTRISPAQISHFNVYVFGAVADSTQPIGPFAAKRSPAEVRIRAQNSNTPISFIVQTVLKNGQVSDITFSPSISTFTESGALVAGDYPDGSIPLTAVQDGTPGQVITWNAGGVVTTIGPGTADYILTGAGTGAVPLFQTLTFTESKTSSFSATANKLFRLYLCDCSSGAITATLPTLSSAIGRVFSFKKTDSSGNNLILDGNGAETIDGSTTLRITSRYDNAILVPGPTEWSII